MAVKSLYIVGNGFDRHHGMKTSYYDFAEYLRNADNHLYYLLESYINPMSEDSLWAYFEENLANMDVEAILNDNTNRLPDYASDSFRDSDRYIFPDIMQDTLEKLTKGLFERFKSFIQAVEIPAPAVLLMLKLNREGLFFTFNYTPTLEELYQIHPANILYIHNRGSSYYNDLVLGHGISPEKLKPEDKIPPEGLSDEEEREWYETIDDYEYSFNTGKDTIYDYFKRSFKPTRKIIEKNADYFSSLSEVVSVHVLGHSLSDVDLPYISTIKDSVSPNAIWHVSYFSAAEKQSHFETLSNMGIAHENIKMFKLAEIQIANAQLDLDL